MIKKTSILTAAILIMVLTACRPQADSSQGGPEDMNIAAKRNTNPDVSDSDLSELVNGNSAFAFDLYHALHESDEGNLIFSPYSVSLALAMTQAGARTTTEQAIADTMHYSFSQDQLHPAFNALDLDLTTREEQAEPDPDAEGERFQLNIANTIWGQEGFGFKKKFLKTIGTNYGAGLQTLDFEQQPEESRQVINQWVADQTEDRIKDIMPSGSITPATQVVLANAIYFNASWLYPFYDVFTSDEPFTLLDGSQVTVPMMSQLAILGYAKGEGYRAVGKPYFGDDMEMIAILPDEGRFEEVEQKLSSDLCNDITQSMVYSDVMLSMPRFEFESSVPLIDVLKEMGMSEAFTAGADFSGISKQGLYISEVRHKAFIKVDENGTEAAAATVEAMEEEESEHRTIVLNRPFILLIRDRQTGTILFLGRVINPAS